MTPEPTQDNDLRDLVAVVRRRKWSITLIMLVVVAATMWFTSKQVPIYRSDADVLVRPIGPINYQTFFYGLVNLETEAGIAESYPVAAIAAKRLDSGESPERLLAGVNAVGSRDNDILSISYESVAPAEAQAGAQAFADAYLEYRRDRALEQAKDQTKDSQRQLDELDRRIKELQTKLRATEDPAQQQSLIAQQSNLSARQGILQQQIQSISGQNVISGGGGEVVGPADLPRVPASPSPVRNAALAIIVGAALGLGLAFGRERLDNRLRGRRDFEALIEAPVLATIPQVRSWRRSSVPQIVSLSDSRGPAAEAYRSLRTNMQYLAREQGVQVVTVTSAKMGDGKTTTVANLSVSLAQSGRKVIVVSCDLRKPRLHAFFDLPNDVGVTSLLTREAGLPDVVKRTQVENLRLVASGPVLPNPAELLSSEAIDELINDLRPTADFVIFDTPPILAVADALILGPKTDGVLLVADAGSGARDDISHVRQELEQVGGRIIGGVFNSFDPDRALYYSPQYRRRYGYGYGYGAYYGQPEGNGQAPRGRKWGRKAKKGSETPEGAPTP